MPRALRSLGLALLLCALLLAPRSPEPLRACAAGGPAFIGPSGCAGASCHGGGRGPRGRSSGQEYVVWSKKDPHARSIQALYSDWAKDVVAALNPSLEAPIAEASKDDRCLRCHSLHVPDEAQRGKGYDPEDGITCERCHGPAEGWRDIHFKEGTSYEATLAQGRRDLRPLSARAELCLDCHLHQDQAFVEAGHPELTFELFTYSQRQDPHWSEEEPWGELKQWLAGQALICARSCERIAAVAGADEGRIRILALRAAPSAWLLRGLAESLPKSPAFAEGGGLARLEGFAGEAAIPREGLAALLRADAEALRALAAADWPLTEAAAAALFEALKGLASAELDEFQAEQLGAALAATQAAHRQGGKPRERRSLRLPKALEALQLRPGMYLPEGWWDEEGAFKAGAWAAAARELKALE